MTLRRHTLRGEPRARGVVGAPLALSVAITAYFLRSDWFRGYGSGGEVRLHGFLDPAPAAIAGIEHRGTAEGDAIFRLSSLPSARRSARAHAVHRADLDDHRPSKPSPSQLTSSIRAAATAMRGSGPAMTRDGLGIERTTQRARPDRRSPARDAGRRCSGSARDGGRSPAVSRSTISPPSSASGRSLRTTLRIIAIGDEADILGCRAWRRRPDPARPQSRARAAWADRRAGSADNRAARASSRTGNNSGRARDRRGDEAPLHAAHRPGAHNGRWRGNRRRDRARCRTDR